MRGLILGMLVLVCTNSQAQEATYLSKLQIEKVYDADKDEYVRVSHQWDEQKFKIEREYFALELTGDTTYAKVWWAYYGKSESGSECYYTEKDLYKICVNYELDHVNIYSDSKDGRFQKIWKLTQLYTLD